MTTLLLGFAWLITIFGAAIFGWLTVHYGRRVEVLEEQVAELAAAVAVPLEECEVIG